MNTFAKKVFNFLIKDEENIIEDFRFYIIINYFCSINFLCCFIFMGIFCILSIFELILMNALGLLIFIYCFTLNKKGLNFRALVFGMIIISSNIILTTICIGWNSGFHLYFFCIIPLVFFSTNIKLWVKIIMTISISSVYCMLMTLMRSFASIYYIEDSKNLIINYFNVFLVFTIITILAYCYNYTVQIAELKLKKAYRSMEVLAKTDPLTGLLNRRSMNDLLNYEKELYSEEERLFSIIIADIDNFKQFNDNYGHDCGDYVLVNIANNIKATLRREDKIARWGGEEFLILLSGTSIKDGVIVAEKIRRSIEETKIDYNGVELRLTMTFGVSEFKNSIQEMTSIADKNLYYGKENGKNRVISA